MREFLTELHRFLLHHGVHLEFATAVKFDGENDIEINDISQEYGYIRAVVNDEEIRVYDDAVGTPTALDYSVRRHGTGIRGPDGTEPLLRRTWEAGL